jgi:uncharacterized protein YciI
MLFVIYATDADDALAKRAEHYPAHKAFLSDAARHGVEIVMSGPLVQDDGETRCGSLMVIDAANRAVAENFHHADPFYIAGVWKTSPITVFLRAR